MIKLTRSRTTATVPACFRGQKRRDREKELLRLWRDHLKSGSTDSPNWKTSYWKPGKAHLKKDSAGKCAYCESPTDVVAHGDVEHFRPKSVYWWLAYCFDNHLFACQICNQSYKGDNFPLPPGAVPMAGPAVAASTTVAQLALLIDTFAPDPVDINSAHALPTFVAACQAEQAGLPDPYNEDPEPNFRWEVDATNKEVWLRPRSNSARHEFIVKSCEDFMGLNREELRRWRWKLAYKQLASLREIVEQLEQQGIGGPPRQIAVDAIRDMMATDQPYAGMVRYFVNGAWKMGL